MFTLRNVDSSLINTCSQLKALITDQLCSDITEGNFDIGYIGMHKSMTEPPSSTMFNRSGGMATTASKKIGHGDAVTEAVSQLTAALAPNLLVLPPAKSNSPAKIIDN